MTAIILWCALTIQFVGKPNVRPYPYQQPASTQGTQASAPQNSQAAATHSVHAQNGMPPWYATPEWWLVGVGMLTLGAIYYQSRETAHAAKAAADSVGAINRQAGIMERQTAATERAAEASERSITLQEVALRQWVTIENWRSIVWIPEGGDLSLHIQFDVVNPTDLPLTLDYAFILFGSEGGKAGRRNLIPPKKSHPVITTVKITEEQRVKREQGELVFMVNGYIKFVDALEKERTQEFGGLIGCSKTGVRFVPPYGPGLYITGEKE